MAEEEYDEVDAFTKAVKKQIALNSDRLVQELFAVAFDPDVDPRVKLQAISMLFDRAVPKLGVQHTKAEEEEEKGSRTQLREEIEELIRKQGNLDL